MEGSESSGSESELPAKDMPQKSESDESYSSDSESEERTGPKSLYSIHKRGHIPGHYKQSIEPSDNKHNPVLMTSGADGNPLSMTGGSDDNPVSMTSGADDNTESEDKPDTDTRILTDQFEDTSATREGEGSPQSMEQTSGIFEKSMVLIPSVHVEENLENQPSMRKVPPPVAPKPKPLKSPGTNDSPSIVTRPTPAPRRSKRLKEEQKDEHSLISDIGSNAEPKPNPRLKIDSLKPEMENVESEDLIDQIDIGSANAHKEEIMQRSNDFCSPKVMDTKTKDENTDGNLIQNEMDVFPTDALIDRNDSDTDNEVNKTFDNKFPDTDSVNDQELSDQGMSDTESDVAFGTPGSQTENVLEEVDSNTNIPVEKPVVPRIDANDDGSLPTETPAESKDIESKLDENFETLKTDEQPDTLESSIVVVEKGYGYESIPSTGSSYEIMGESSNTDEKAHISNRISVLDRISMFESKSQASIKRDSAVSQLSSSSFEDVKSDIDESVGMDKSESVVQEVGDIIESSQIDMIHKGDSTGDLAIETPVPMEKETTQKLSSSKPADEASSRCQTPDSNSVSEAGRASPTILLDQSDERSSENESVEQERPPPIPPKSDIVLESMKSFYTTDTKTSDTQQLSEGMDDSKTNVVEEGSTNETVGNLCEYDKHPSDHSLYIEKELSGEKIISAPKGQELSEMQVDETLENEEQKPPPIPPKSESVYESMQSFVEQHSNTNVNDTLKVDVESETTVNDTPGNSMQNETEIPHEQQAPTSSQASSIDHEYSQYQSYPQQQHTPMSDYDRQALLFQQQYYNQFGYCDENGQFVMQNPYVNPGMFHQNQSGFYQQPYVPQSYSYAGTEPTYSNNSYSHQLQEAHIHGGQNESNINRRENQPTSPKRKPGNRVEDTTPKTVEHETPATSESPREEKQKHTSKRQRTSDAHTQLPKQKSEGQIEHKTDNWRNKPSAVKRSESSPVVSRSKPVKKKEVDKGKGVQKKISEIEQQQQEYYIYFKGISDSTKNENLAHFIEAVTKGECDAEKVIFNHQGTCALVTLVMNHKPDVSKIKERIQKRGIEGEKPEVYLMPFPDSIAVSWEGEARSTESLGLYFESEKRCGGGDVKQKPYETEDGSCFVIQFEDTRAVKRVCERSHKFEGKELRVSPYYECKAGAIWDSKLHVLKIPGPVLVQLGTNLLQLLQRDCCQALFQTLKGMYCDTTFTDDGLQVKCTLTPKTLKFRSLLREWENSSKSVINAFIEENISEEQRFQSSQEAWEQLMTQVKSEKILEKGDIVATIDTPGYAVIYVGFKSSVRDIDDKLREFQNRIERQLRKSSESFPIKKLKLKLLVKNAFFEQLKNGMDEDVDIFIGEDEVTIEGQPEEIKEIRVKIYENDNKLSKLEIRHAFSSECVDFIKRKLSKTISTKLGKHNINAEWNIEDREIQIYAFETHGGEAEEEDDYEELSDETYTYSNVDTASRNTFDLIQTLIMDEKKIVQDDVAEVFSSPEWTSFLETLTEEYEDTAEVEYKNRNRELCVYGMKTEAQELKRKVMKFVEENAIKKEYVKCGSVYIKFIKLHRNELTSELEQKLEHHKVKIALNNDTMVISGTKAGVAEAKTNMTKFFDSMVSETYTIQKLAVKDVIRDAESEGTIHAVEKETRCLIILPGESATIMTPGAMNLDRSDDSEDGYDTIGNATSASAKHSPVLHRDKSFKASNGVKVTLVKGEIGEQDGNVIVVTTSPNLNLSSGNACKSVLKAGTQSLQDECKRKYQQDIQFGEIAVVHGGGSLECDRVYLTTLPNWKSEHNAKQILQKVMKDALELASRHKKYSILFCAMGTGQLKYPTDVVAMVMYQAVIDFDQNNPQTTLKDVRFVLYQRDFPTIKVFEEEERMRLEGGGERPTFDLKAGHLTIELSVDNIAQQKVDGILCSTAPNMDLGRSGACQALLRAGGKSLQDDCKSKYNNKLEEGQVAEIGGGKMDCKCVFLTVIPSYSADAIGVLTNVIKTTLQLAERKGLKSLAFPALGTGFLKYPADEVCRCMFQTVTDWAQSNQNSSIKTVRFIMHAKDHKVNERFKSHIMNANGRGKRRNRGTWTPEKALKTTFGAQGRAQSIYNSTQTGIRIGKIELKVVKDDLLSQKTSAIVSSVGDDFEFLGAVAQELIKRYPKIVDKCKRKDKLQTFGNEGAVIMKSSDKFQAKNIVLVRFARDISTWKTRMRKCLELANARSLRSIAFPVLGTGSGFTTFKPDAIAACLFDAVDEYFGQNKKPSIEKVILVVYRGQPAMHGPIMDTLIKKVQEAVVYEKDGYFKKGISKTKKYYQAACNLFMGTKEGVMSKDEKRKYVDEKSSVDIHIHSDCKEDVARCKQELDTKLEKVYTKQKIDEYKDVIKSLTPEETKLLDVVALVDIKTDTNTGIITISGPEKHVSSVKHDLKTKLLKIERQRYEISSADDLYKIVQWHYEEVTLTESVLKPYEKTLNHHIEKAYKENKTDFEFDDDDGDTLVIDFQKLIEYRKSDKEDQFRVLRRDILKAAAGLAIPNEWTEMKDKENIKVVPLKSTDKEYTDIEQRFITEVQTGPYAHRLNFNSQNMQVNKIERIQNRALFHQYQAKKKQMADQKPNLPANLPIERELWHATKQDAITSIQMHGFNRSYSGNANGDPWYGDGVYFAANASYSARGWLSGAGMGPGGKGYMFVVKTLTGEIVKGKKKMRYLPPVDPKNPTVLYDCAVDDVANPMEFVIFNDTQAYPAYIITFTT